MSIAFLILPWLVIRILLIMHNDRLIHRYTTEFQPDYGILSVVLIPLTVEYNYGVLVQYYDPEVTG